MYDYSCVLELLRASAATTHRKGYTMGTRLNDLTNKKKYYYMNTSQCT
jgi:hypothetical protein